jgi:NAD(P)-dependent dehydrogenase (short-subunit alcohol dehydrogenase family)
MTERCFEGKVAVVTGAGRGIGRAIAILLASEGASVVVNDMGGDRYGLGDDRSIAEAVAKEIIKAGGNALAETSSISSMDGARELIEAAIQRYGRIDYLINNAGTARVARIDQMEESDFDHVINVNLKGYFATIKFAAPYLMRQGGAIINMSSPSGFGQHAMSTYSAAKEGVVGLGRTVTRDLGEFGVRCFTVRPMSGNSAMTTPEVMESVRYSMEELHIPATGHLHIGSGVDGYGVPDHVAAVCAWLCTEEAAPLTGRELFAGGGHVALIQQPELIRSRFQQGGWTFQAMRDPANVAALIEGSSNPYRSSPRI